MTPTQDHWLRPAAPVAFRDESEATALLTAYHADALNPAQRAVLERIETRLEAKRP